MGIRKGSELYEVQTSDGACSWRGLQGAGVRWLDEPPPFVAAFSAMLRCGEVGRAACSLFEVGHSGSSLEALPAKLRGCHSPPSELPWSLKCNSCRLANCSGVMWVCFGLARGGQQKSSACTHMALIARAVAEMFQPACSSSFSGGSCISGQAVLGAAQQEGVQQCLMPVLTACGDAAAASTAPAEGPAMPQAGQSLPDIHCQVDALVAQDGEQSTNQFLGV